MSFGGILRVVIKKMNKNDNSIFVMFKFLFKYNLTFFIICILFY